MGKKQGQRKPRHHNRFEKAVRKERVISIASILAMKRSRMDVLVCLAVATALWTPASVECFAPAVKRVSPGGHHASLPMLHYQHSKSQRTTVVSHSTSTSASSPYNNNRHSSSDWLYNIQSIPSSTILKEVRHPVLAVFTWSAIVTVLHKALLEASSSAVRAVAVSMQLPGTAHSFLMSALGLLLVFRTNSAYQRFREGRQVWQEILSVARNLSRTARLYRKEIGEARFHSMTNLLAAFPYLLRHHIRPGCLCESTKAAAAIPTQWRIRLNERPVDVETRHEGDNLLKARVGLNGISIKDKATRYRPYCWVDRRCLPWRLFESQTALSQVTQSHNRPLWVCDRLGREISRIPYGPNFSSRERLTMLQHIEKLTNAVGQCERIHQTAVPLNYARHSLRSLTIWLFTLPFCLVKDMGFLTPLVAAVTAWTLFGIYQIGYSIEDPFQGSLRLSILCDSIRRDVLVDNDNDSEGSAERVHSGDKFLTESIGTLRASGVSGSKQCLQSVFSNGTIVDSTIQQDLDVLLDPPRLVAETEERRLRSIRVDSLP